MAQLGNVAESFLDGFGCLGAIVEPCVRPGSMENLIQEETVLVEVEWQAGAKISLLAWLRLGAMSFLPSSVSRMIDAHVVLSREQWLFRATKDRATDGQDKDRTAKGEKAAHRA